MESGTPPRGSDTLPTGEHSPGSAFGAWARPSRLHPHGPRRSPHLGAYYCGAPALHLRYPEAHGRYRRTVRPGLLLFRHGFAARALRHGPGAGFAQDTHEPRPGMTAHDLRKAAWVFPPRAFISPPRRTPPAAQGRTRNRIGCGAWLRITMRPTVPAQRTSWAGTRDPRRLTSTATG